MIIYSLLKKDNEIVYRRKKVNHLYYIVIQSLVHSIKYIDFRANITYIQAEKIQIL